jgi:uncharacterized protein
MNALIFSLSFAVMAVLLFMLGGRFDRRITVGFAVLAALYVGLDDLLTGLPTVITSLGVIGDKWNWMGKLLSLILAASSILALQLALDTVGLTLRQRHLKIGLLALVGFILWGTCLGLVFEPGRPSAETLAFQATMPGLAEEIAYRGIAPALLLGLLRGQSSGDDMPWSVILVTAMLFGIWHGLQYSAGRFTFEPLAALSPLCGGIAGGWLRFKTGSLLFPILGHGLANVAFHVAGGLAA